MMTRLPKGKGERMLPAAMVCLVLVFFLTASASFTAAAEKYPTRPVTIVVPYTPGSTLDIHCQLFADRLSKILGQPFIREHKPGAGGTLGASLVARGKPDGYSIYPGTSSSIVLAPIIQKLDYKFEDFYSIGTYARAGTVVLVKSDSRWKTFKDFADEAKKNPGKLQAGTYGKFTNPEMVIELLKKYGIKLNFVPYKATAEVIPALLGGHIDAAFISSTLGQLEAGTVRILAVSDHQRTPLYPEVMTLKELGYPISIPAYYALCVPAKTPKAVIGTLEAAMQECYKKYGEEITQGLKKLEHTAWFLNAQESMEKFREDSKMYMEIARELGWTPRK